MARLNVAINQEDNHLSSLPVTFSGSGNNTVIAGLPGKVIRVYRLFLVLGSTPTNLTFQSGAGTAFTGALPFVASAAMVLDFDTKPWFLTNIGDGFVINTSAGVQVSGAVYYTQV